MKRRLVLFDIDGTLIMSGRIGSRAVRQAFLEQFGVEDATAGFFFDGKTDPGILRELLERHGLAHRHCVAERARFFERYTEALKCERERVESGHIHPGVTPLLARLRSHPDAVVGLLTGNIRAGAQIKLERFDLWREFPFGAFGDDAETRDELVPIAMKRAEAAAGIQFEPSCVFVIGDSLRDVGCAHANGAMSIAVATGNTPMEELAGARPYALFRDLSETEKVLEALGLLS